MDTQEKPRTGNTEREERRIGAGSWTSIDAERQNKEQGRGRMKHDRELGQLAAYAGKPTRPTRSPVGCL